MTTQPPVQRGGCLCGAVQFEVKGPTVWAGYCHCSSCRRFTGAAVTNWLGVTASAFRLTQGVLKRYERGDGVARGFCAVCGSSLTYSAAHFPDYLQVHIGALDAPERITPSAHVHCGEALPWLHLSDDLPRFAASAADTDWQA